MAEVKKTILIDVKLDKGNNEREVENLTKKIEQLKKVNQDLTKENKELAKAGQENSKQYIENAKQIEINRQKISDNTASRRTLIQAMSVEANSIRALQIENSKLIKERNSLNFETEEGAKRINEINERLDENNAIIKQNISGLEQQKMNVGNYTQSIKDAISEINVAGVSVGDLTGKIASFANPVTAAVAVLGALSAAYARSSIGAKDLEFAQNRLTSVVNILTDRFAAFFSSVENGEGFFSKLLDRFLTAIRYIPIVALYTKALGIDLKEVADQSEAAALASDQLNEIYEERELINARVNERLEQNAELLTELSDKTKSANDRQKIALQIQQNLQKSAEERIASIDQEIAAIRRKNVGIQDEGVFIREINKLIAERSKIESDAARQSERIQKQLNAILRTEAKEQAAELERIRKEQAAREAQIIKEVSDAEKQQLENNLNFLKRVSDERLVILKFQFEQGLLEQEEYEMARMELEIQALEDQKNFLIANGEETLAIESQILDRKIAVRSREIAANKKLADENVKVKKAEQQQIELLVAQGINTAAALFGRNKTIQSALTVISSLFSAQKAYESQFVPIPTPDSPVRGAIAAGLALAQGFARVQAINSVPGFATGGVIPSNLGTPINRSNGDNRLITAKVGEAILTPEQQSRVGRDRLAAAGVPGFATGGIVTGEQTRIASNAARESLDVNQLASLVNQTQPVLVWQDFELSRDAIEQPRRTAIVIQ